MPRGTPPRNRKARALAKLTQDIDVWVATASANGRPALVPMSLTWDGERIVLATPAGNVTARNAAATGVARLALGATRDVVMIDANVTVVPLAEAEPAVIARYVERTGWDPRRQKEKEWVLMLMTPTRIQVWRGPDEIPGRLVMERGEWLT